MEMDCSEHLVKAIYTNMGPHLDWIYNLIAHEELLDLKNWQYIASVPYHYEASAIVSESTGNGFDGKHFKVICKFEFNYFLTGKPTILAPDPTTNISNLAIRFNFNYMTVLLYYIILALSFHCVFLSFS